MSIASISPPTVTIRRRWNAPEAVDVAISALRDFRILDEAGGVCRSSPRAFLHAHILCDRVDAVRLGHVCGADPGPHELLVCLLPADNPPAVYHLVNRLSQR